MARRASVSNEDPTSVRTDVVRVPAPEVVGRRFSAEKYPRFRHAGAVVARAFRAGLGVLVGFEGDDVLYVVSPDDVGA